MIFVGCVCAFAFVAALLLSSMAANWCFWTVLGWAVHALRRCAAPFFLLGAGVALGQQQLPPQLGLLPGQRPSAAEIELGRQLFFDPRLSLNGTVACATCHDPRKGWSDGLPRAVGIFNQVGQRNSPTIINAAYTPLVFHDGRAAGLNSQALLPEVNPIEMGFQNIDQVVRRLEMVPGYVSQFASIYGIDPVRRSAITSERLAFALSAFESTVVSFGAPVDRYEAGDAKALSADAQIGYRIFQKANCKACHPPPLYTDNAFHNNGFEFASKAPPYDQGRFGVLPPQLRNLVGPDTVRAFKTPTLREIHRTAPYGHAGRFADLERVVAHYAGGGFARFENGQVLRDRFTDPRVVRIRELKLTREQQAYLVKFLKEGFASPNYPLIEEPMLP